MCLLIVKPKGREIPLSYLINASLMHPHGAGIAWSDGQRSYMRKGVTLSGKEIHGLLGALYDVPCIIHFRYATHGSVSEKNTHPFRLPRGWLAAHNGVIDSVKCRADESDTRAFLRLHVAPLLRKGRSLHDKRTLSRLSRLIGHSKMAFLSPSGKISIANEERGHWNGGVWYSNYTYQDLVEYEPPRCKICDLSLAIDETRYCKYCVEEFRIE